MSDHFKAKRFRALNKFYFHYIQADLDTTKNNKPSQSQNFYSTASKSKSNVCPRILTRLNQSSDSLSRRSPNNINYHQQTASLSSIEASLIHSLSKHQFQLSQQDLTLISSSTTSSSAQSLTATSDQIVACSSGNHKHPEIGNLIYLT